MTIAVAIKALDGVIIAADRQETAGDWKSEQGKIVFSWRATSPTGHLIVTGAGDGVHIDAVTSKLGDWFLNSSETDINKGAAEMEAIHQHFYSETVIPISDDPRHQPDYSLLLAYKCGERSAIYSTQQLSFKKTGSYDAVGIGSMVAKTMLRKLWVPAPIHELLNLTAYVIQEVKGSVDGCGLATDIVFARKEAFKNWCPEFLEQDEIHEMEGLFRSYRKVERYNFHHCVAHLISGHTEKAFQEAEEYREKLREAFQKLNDKRMVKFSTKPSISETSEQAH